MLLIIKADNNYQLEKMDKINEERKKENNDKDLIILKISIWIYPRKMRLSIKITN